MTTEFRGDLQGQGHAFAVVVARFNEAVTGKLLEGALDAFERHGVGRDDIDVVRVPGSLEIPLAARRLAETRRYSAIVAVGCVIRHETRHFELVAEGATQGIVQTALETGVPVLHAVLACENLQQALDRAGGQHGNKGYEAAVNAIEMANLLRRLRAD
ncbi:MAG: 6,7-dimethyl-8-ribityllumazine synthase [Chloroflexi bacterium]|nr:6,7-dimethyl-8-ribityllumazine synthase [Chloroflexota bacterium]